jgi:CMP-N,N'-diacetyllegionaminic acid synthase
VSDAIAIIPARSGSKSVISKNVKLLSGHPLIAYSIAAAKLSKKIDKVIVSTDSIEYAKIAEQYGAETPFIRPEKYSTDVSSDRDFLLHAIQWFLDNEISTPEYWVHLRPTTPLRSIKIIDNAINQIMKDLSSTSLRSGHKAPESPLKWFTKENTYFKGLILGEDFNLPKESFEQVYIPDGYVDILKSSYLINNQMIHGPKMIGFESPLCVEVDSEEEFEYIQYQLDTNGSELLDYLNQLRG